MRIIKFFFPLTSLFFPPFDLKKHYIDYMISKITNKLLKLSNHPVIRSDFRPVNKCNTCTSFLIKYQKHQVYHEIINFKQWAFNNTATTRRCILDHRHLTL